MMLQALSDFYDTLVAQGKAPAAGWTELDASYALQLNEKGEVINLVDLRQTVETQKNGKTKTHLIPRTFNLPIRLPRTVGVKPHLLCDKAQYILGFRTDQKYGISQNTFEVSKSAHLALLEQVYTPAAEAVKQFYKTWNPADAETHPVIGSRLTDIGISYLLFLYKDQFVHEDKAIQQAYQKQYENSLADPDAPQMFCMDTGEMEPIKLIHEKIMGLDGAQKSGASLVSANSDSSCSYGLKKNAVAPMSIHVAENYVKALNYLLKNPNMHCKFGTTTVVFWANSGETAYQDLLGNVFQNYYSDEAIYDVVRAISKHKPAVYNKARLNPDMKFYILGISPNMSRIIVRFYLVNTFGKFMENIQAHYDRLGICNGDAVQPAPAIWQMLYETINQKAKNKDKEIQPHLSNQIIESILNGKPYPMTMLTGINLRIKAEIYDKPINPRKAAMIKAYYLACPNTTESMKGALTMSLNPDCTDTGYLLGRLFAELEHLQDDATNPQTGIRAQYFNRACTMPAQVFPYIINMAQKHLKKLASKEKTKPAAIWHDKRITALMTELNTQYPARLSMQEQGAFQLGYYHQRNERFIKKAKPGTQAENEDMAIAPAVETKDTPEIR